MWITRRCAVAGACALAFSTLPSHAETLPPLKIGMLVELTGTYAEYGHQVRNAVNLFLARRGNRVAGREVQIVWKDTTGPSPELAKRLARDLVVNDKVDLLAGFGLTPVALAAAPVATEAKVPLVVMNAAASSSVVAASPYIVRLSFTMGQVAAPLADWAYAAGIRRIYTLVAAYSPGFEVERAFRKAFEARGGRIVGEVGTTLVNPEFGPYLQRAGDARPDAIFAFAGSGENGLQLIKAYKERGLENAGIRLLAIGDLTDDAFLQAEGDAALGIITSHHYSADHASPENAEFVAQWQKAYGADSRPNYYAAATWDGMTAIYDVVARLQGRTQPVEKVMEAFRAVRFTGVRGPIAVDADRDVVQNVYVRRVEKKNGRLANVEVQAVPAVRDPGKSAPRP